MVLALLGQLVLLLGLLGRRKRRGFGLVGELELGHTAAERLRVGGRTTLALGRTR